MILKAKNIYKSFDGKNYIIKEFNRIFNENEFIGIMGSSGSGKTTLLALLATLLKPNKGEIYFQSINLTNLKNEKLAKIRNKYFGFIFQSANMIPHLRVWENVVLPFYYSNYINLKKLKIIAEKYLDIVGLKDYTNRNVTTLSGGEQQRVAIARALVTEPKIIFADEPTGNLDKNNTEIVINILQENAKKGKCIIMVTHDKYITKYCTDIITLSKYE